MPTAKVRNLQNKEVGEVTLSDAVFGVELNEALIHAAVKNYLANRRQGTSATKTRGNVSGSGRKLWKQKGTGRARVASIRSPLWKGGGNVHGPQPRDWSYKLPTKMRRGALRSALSERLREGNLIVIDEMTIDSHRTKDFLSTIGMLELAGDSKKPVKTLIVDSLDNNNLILSSRNVQKTKITNSFGLNIYDLLYHEKLLISKAAVEELNSLLDPKREKVGNEPDAIESEEKPKAKKQAKAKEEKPKVKKEAKAKKEKVEEPAAEEIQAEEIAPTVETESVEETAPTIEVENVEENVPAVEAETKENEEATE